MCGVSWVLSPHSTILASKVFKEASWGAVGVVMVGKQVASPTTLSTASIWTGTLFLQFLQPQSGDAPSGRPKWGLGPSPHPLESIPGDLIDVVKDLQQGEDASPNEQAHLSPKVPQQG